MQQRCTSLSKVSGVIVIGRKFEVFLGGIHCDRSKETGGGRGCSLVGLLKAMGARVDANTRGAQVL